jgi:hypothetical protein
VADLSSANLDLQQQLETAQAGQLTADQRHLQQAQQLEQLNLSLQHLATENAQVGM